MPEHNLLWHFLFYEATLVLQDLVFEYNSDGQRICKIVKPHNPAEGVLSQQDWVYTYYLRDAQGNVLETYERKQTVGIDLFAVKEQHLYGSSRVGMIQTNLDLLGASAPGDAIVNVAGERVYELSNHLGNVLTTMSDKRVAVDVGANGTVDYFKADILSATDYAAFGAPLAGRSFSAPSYRYGFNGKENDPESVGTGEGLQDYGFRIYNPALGKFLSVDPLTSQYAMLTPYQFASNTPIAAIDLDGLEQEIVINQADIQWPIIQVHNTQDVVESYEIVISSQLKRTLTNDQVYNDLNHCVCPEGAILQMLYPTIESLPANGKLTITPTYAVRELYQNMYVESVTWSYVYEVLNPDGTIMMDEDGSPMQYTGSFKDYPNDYIAGVLIQTNPGNPQLDFADLTLFGSNGPQINSKSWNFRNSKDGERIDIENPNPGKAPGNVHYQNNTRNEKYYYDKKTNKFYEDKDFKKAISDTRNKELLENKQVKKYLNKALKYLSE